MRATTITLLIYLTLCTLLVHSVDLSWSSPDLWESPTSVGPLGVNNHFGKEATIVFSLQNAAISQENPWSLHMIELIATADYHPFDYYQNYMGEVIPLVRFGGEKIKVYNLFTLIEHEQITQFTHTIQLADGLTDGMFISFYACFDGKSFQARSPHHTSQDSLLDVGLYPCVIPESRHANRVLLHTPSIENLLNIGIARISSTNATKVANLPSSHTTSPLSIHNIHIDTIHTNQTSQIAIAQLSSPITPTSNNNSIPTQDTSFNPWFPDDFTPITQTHLFQSGNGRFGVFHNVLSKSSFPSTRLTRPQDNVGNADSESGQTVFFRIDFNQHLYLADRSLYPNLTVDDVDTIIVNFVEVFSTNLSEFFGIDKESLFIHTVSLLNAPPSSLEHDRRRYNFIVYAVKVDKNIDIIHMYIELKQTLYVNKRGWQYHLTPGLLYGNSPRSYNIPTFSDHLGGLHSLSQLFDPTCRSTYRRGWFGKQYLGDVRNDGEITEINTSKSDAMYLCSPDVRDVLGYAPDTDGFDTYDKYYLANQISLQNAELETASISPFLFWITLPCLFLAIVLAIVVWRLKNKPTSLPSLSPKFSSSLCPRFADQSNTCHTKRREKYSQVGNQQDEDENEEVDV